MPAQPVPREGLEQEVAPSWQRSRRRLPHSYPGPGHCWVPSRVCGGFHGEGGGGGSVLSTVKQETGQRWEPSGCGAAWVCAPWEQREPGEGQGLGLGLPLGLWWVPQNRSRQVLQARKCFPEMTHGFCGQPRALTTIGGGPSCGCRRGSGLCSVPHPLRGPRRPGPGWAEVKP